MPPNHRRTPARVAVAVGVTALAGVAVWLAAPTSQSAQRVVAASTAQLPARLPRTAPDTQPVAGPPATRAPAPRVFVLGDSLTVGTEPWLGAALRRHGWTLTGVSARVGRPVAEGLRILRARAARLPSTVLVALGTNDFGAGRADVTRWLRTVRSIVGARRVVWVDLCLDDRTAPRLRGWRRTNAALDAVAPLYGVEVADWCAFAARHHVVNGPDGVHYGPHAYRERAAFYAVALGAAPTTPAISRDIARRPDGVR